MPTLPPIVPERTTAGIAVDPRTLERVVPQTKRADGSVRKELKIRPGFTPQEDVGRFKTSRQQYAETRALPKGHIIGWVPPSSSQNKSQVGSSGGGGVKVPTTDANGQPLSKAALKNAKRKAKKIANAAAGGGSRAQDPEEEEEEKLVVGAVDDAPDAWDEEGDEEAPAANVSAPVDNSYIQGKKKTRADPGIVDAVANELDKLAVSK